MTATPASSIATITVVDRRTAGTASSDVVPGSGEIAHLERPAYLGDRARPKWLGFLVRTSIPTLLVVTWWWYTRPGPFRCRWPT